MYLAVLAARRDAEPLQHLRRKKKEPSMLSCVEGCISFYLKTKKTRKYKQGK